MRQRQSGLDLIRVTGFFLVTLFHAFLYNGYYGQPGKYQYLSEQLKSICNSRDGIGYVKAGKIIRPVEVKTFDDGSVWMKLDATITCLAVGVDGKTYVK